MSEKCPSCGSERRDRFKPPCSTNPAGYDSFHNHREISDFGHSSVSGEIAKPIGKNSHDSGTVWQPCEKCFTQPCKCVETGGVPPTPPDWKEIIADSIWQWLHGKHMSEDGEYEVKNAHLFSVIDNRNFGIDSEIELNALAEFVAQSLRGASSVASAPAIGWDNVLIVADECTADGCNCYERLEKLMGSPPSEPKA